MPTTSNFGWTTPADTDLVKDGAAAIRTLGNGVDASLVDLKGGTTDQVLAKNSNTDLDFKWVTSDDANAIQNAIVDAKGDLISATAADTPARLASSGVNGNVLTVDTSEPTGLKWAAPAGDITEVQAGTGISVASGTGPIPVVTSTVATTFDAKGDLVAGTGADTFAKRTVGADYGFLQALNSETTGLSWNDGAWTTFTPTVSAATGTITTASATGRYIRVGRLCIVQYSVTVTTNGTGAGALHTTVPFNSRNNETMGVGREVNATGDMCQIEAQVTYCAWRTYANAYPAANNRAFIGTFIYEVA